MLLESFDDPYYDARLAALERINRDRASAKLAPVELDSFSSTVADHHCQQMAAYRYLSHWDLQGLLPYHRYHFAGGRDHVQENLSGTTIFSGKRSPIPTDPSEIASLLLQGHERFMAEQPPLDGHRANILRPAHTHLGIGFAVVEQEFTMAEEFLNRYVRLAELPVALPNRTIRVEGEMLRKGYGPYYCVVFYEEPPRPRTVSQLERTYSYSDTEGYECATVPPWNMSFDQSHGRFRFSLNIRDCGAGVYHLLLWVRGDIRSIPYQLHPGATRIDTKQAIAAAGWVFTK